MKQLYIVDQIDLARQLSVQLNMIDLIRVGFLLEFLIIEILPKYDIVFIHPLLK